MLVWILYLLSPVLAYVVARVAYGVFVSPWEPKIRDWLFKTQNRVAERLLFWMVRDVVTGKAHWQDSQNLFIILMLVGFVPGLAGMAALGVSSDGLAKFYRRDVGVEKTVVASDETTAEKLNRHEADARFYSRASKIGLAVFICGTLVGFSWFGFRRMLTVDHERYMARLQLLLSPDEIKELIRAEKAIGLRASTVYAYLGLIQRLGEAHGLGDLSHIWPAHFCHEPAKRRRTRKRKDSDT